jgi:LPXTG-motif cell wall-anchored protein
VTTEAEPLTPQPEAHGSFAVVKIGLVAATVVALLSLGGLMMFVFPALVLGHLWALRRAHSAERWVWFVLASASAAQWVWEVTYPSTGGSSPSAWIIMGMAVAITASLFSLVDRRARASGS